MLTRGKKIFRLLAAILEYPTDRIVEQVDDTMTVLGFMNGEAKLRLARFRDFCLENPLVNLQRIYSRTFDRDAACCPYVGRHLLSRERSRSMFMAKLKEHYSTQVDGSEELPDHIAVMLRSLIVQESVEEARDLICHCLVPGVKKMIGQLKDGANPYKQVLQAVLLTLEQTGDTNPSAMSSEQYVDYAFAGISEKKRYG